MNVDLPDEAATVAFAARVARALPESLGGITLLLEGDLGSGKSTFARALIRALGHSGPVPSPTYTLVEPYQVAAGGIYHVDLYRVSSEEELRYLGWNELDSGFRLVEWPDRAPGIAAEADLVLTLEYAGSGRGACLEPVSARGEAIIDRIQAVTEPLDE
jgi:tRNA threonylcarbamoyladenosine biosynthesis protein TsaE